MAHEPIMGTGRVQAREPRGAELGELSWSEGRIVLCRRSWAAREAELSWQAPFHSLLLTERGKTARTRVKVGGRVVYDGGDRAGALSVVPAGLERVASYRDAEIVFATLWFDPALAHTLLGGAAALGSLPLHVNGRDPVVAALLADLSASVARGEDPGSLYVEQLTALAWSRLLRLRAAGLPERRVAPLPRNVLGRVRDVAVSPDGRHVASVTSEGHLVVRAIGAGERPVLEWHSQGETPESVVFFGPDAVVTSGWRNSGRLRWWWWDPEVLAEKLERVRAATEKR